MEMKLQSIDNAIQKAYDVSTSRKEGFGMSKSVNVSLRMSEELKKNMETVCADMGITMSTAFTIFATRVVRDQRIPFEINADPFYSAKNMAHLDASIQEFKEGKIVEHDLIEVDDE